MIDGGEVTSYVQAEAESIPPGTGEVGQNRSMRSAPYANGVARFDIASLIGGPDLGEKGCMEDAVADRRRRDHADLRVVDHL